jgi:hypothetical protein
MNRNFIVVSFFTPEYVNDALRLSESLELWNVPNDIREVPTTGNWLANNNYKPLFCRDKLMEYNIPTVWVDADAEVLSYPILFDELYDYDIGVCYRNRRQRPHEMLAGTLYFNTTERSRFILDTWIDMCKDNSISDQIALERIISANIHTIKLFEFPYSYVRIFDAEDMSETDPPVILHHQASRRLKKVVNCK